MRDEWATVDGGLRLHLLRGDGRGLAPPFVLLHGLASNARLWAGVGEILTRRGHDVVAVDLRGHGRSAKPAGGYDTVTVADDVVRLLGHLGLDRPILAGQSWGGNVALEVATRRPAPVRGVVCVDGGWIEPSNQFPDWDECARRLAPPPLDGLAATDVEAMFRSSHPDWPDDAIAASMANFEHRDDGTVSPWLARDRHLQIVRDLWERHPPAQYPDVAVPVLLLPADTGAAWMDRVREEVAKAEVLLPVARTVWVQGDHDLHAQQPAAVAAVLAAGCDEGFFP